MTTYLTKNKKNNWVLINGNSESEESWESYEDAKAAMVADDELEKGASEQNDPELYFSNTDITWK